MKSSRSAMSTICAQQPLNLGEKCNVTMQRGRDSRGFNMASSTQLNAALAVRDCPIIDSILTQDEAIDIVSMMMKADELEDDAGRNSFCTSTQMGGRSPQLKPRSPALSPLSSPPGPQGHGLLFNDKSNYNEENVSAQLQNLCKTPTSA